MKKTLLPLFFLLAAISITANPVDKTKAEQIARNFYSMQADASLTKGALKVEQLTDKWYEGKLCYYMVKFSGSGYVIVSADDAFFPIIGYSFEDNLTIADLPPAMQWWLDMQAKDMIASVADNKDVSLKQTWETLLNNTTAKKSTSKKSVSSLLKCNWNQGESYNYHCPEHNAGPGGKCYAGCVATAMAQIMYYHKYPATGLSSHSYYHPHYDTISVDFSKVTYDWSSMTNSINSNSREAISTLIYNCGVGVDMYYTPMSSGAVTSAAAYAFVHYFNYSNRLKYVVRGDPTYNAAWNQMLIDNLENKQPILYSGTGSAGGHAFVCDGYQDSCFFHFNWGWSGMGNGYFYVSDLNSGNGDFSNNQSAVVNIAPYDYPYCQGRKTYNEVSRTFGDGSEYSKYWNNSNCEWLIAPDSGTNIEVRFLIFQTEANHDILTVYDGYNTLAPVLGQYSGHNLPAKITSTGNKMLLHFATDSINQDAGWELTYTAITTGIEERQAENSFYIYPNPGNGLINIEINNRTNEHVNVEIANISGQIVYSKQFSNSAHEQIDLRDYPRGIYFVKVKGKDFVKTKKVVIY